MDGVVLSLLCTAWLLLVHPMTIYCSLSLFPKMSKTIMGQEKTITQQWQTTQILQYHQNNDQKQELYCELTMIDRLTDWLINWLTEDWLIDWLRIDWLIDWLILSDWLIDIIIACAGGVVAHTHSRETEQRQRHRDNEQIITAMHGHSSRRSNGPFQQKTACAQGELRDERIGSPTWASGHLKQRQNLG